MIDIGKFTEYLKVDKLNLDNELVEHAVLLGTVSDEYAQALSVRDDFKEQLTTLDAELADEARTDLEGPGKRVTEAMVSAYVQTHKDHKQTYKRYAEARLLAARLGALKESFQARGYMLRDLCSLYVSNYFESGSVKLTVDSDRAVYLNRRNRMTEARNG